MTPPTQQDKPIDLEALRLAAEAATPGIWLAVHEYNGQRLTSIDTENEFSSVMPENGSWPEDVICEVWGGNHLDDANARHIAAWNPATALALFALIDAQQKKIAALEGVAGFAADLGISGDCIGL